MQFGSHGEETHHSLPLGELFLEKMTFFVVFLGFLVTIFNTGGFSNQHKVIPGWDATQKISESEVVINLA